MKLINRGMHGVVANSALSISSVRVQVFTQPSLGMYTCLQWVAVLWYGRCCLLHLSQPAQGRCMAAAFLAHGGHTCRHISHAICAAVLSSKVVTHPDPWLNSICSMNGALHGVGIWNSAMEPQHQTSFTRCSQCRNAPMTRKED